eukprot:m.248500 g.248500  ORF g.248500 m.248500 type:complete len:98 (-) comp19078_c1_seq2:209-502(-)
MSTRKASFFTPKQKSQPTPSRTVVDDVKVTQEVAEFNRQVFLAWVHNNTAAGKDWRTEVARSSCWRQDWRNASAALAALEDWIANPAAVRPCRPPVA